MKNKKGDGRRNAKKIRYSSELIITEHEGPDNTLEIRVSETVISGAYAMRKENRNSQFLETVKKNETFRNLTYAALITNGELPNIEKMLMEIYDKDFKDQSELHNLIKNNEKEIYALISQGVTNLGTYLGEFTLGDRAILPLLLGRAILEIQEDKINVNVEDKMIRLLRKAYSPNFNRNPQETIAEIRTKASEMSGKKRGLYDKLLDHYVRTESLVRELSS